MTEYMSLSASSQFCFLFQDITSLSFTTATTEGKWCNMISSTEHRRESLSVWYWFSCPVFIDGRNRRQNPFYASRVRGESEEEKDKEMKTLIITHHSHQFIFGDQLSLFLWRWRHRILLLQLRSTKVLCSLVINYTAIDSQIESESLRRKLPLILYSLYFDPFVFST